MRLRGYGFLVALHLMVPSLAAQTVAPKSGPSASSGGGAAAPAIVDVAKIDPEAYQAIAIRLPDGERPKIDGKLDDEVWRLAQPSGGFVQRDPGLGESASQATEFRVLYDDKRIYFGVWAFDTDPSSIRASEMKRDALLRKGDQIRVIVDTFHDHRNAYYFSTNPLGALKDAHSTENGRTINWDWNGVWECETSKDDRGWYAEISVPLSQLRFQESEGETTWGLNVARVVIRRNEDSFWVPYPREWGPNGQLRMAHAGVLMGLKGLKARRRLEVVPYIGPRVARDFDAGTPTDGDAKYGLDLRVGVTPNLTADFTYKTDFAQVEADQEVVNLSRFSLFFPEKRQFFTESAGIFDYGRAGIGGGDTTTAGLLGLFYSRRIGLDEANGREIPILGGGKLTGRAGPFAVGVMNIETEETSFRTPQGQVAVPRANYSVLRAKRSLLSASSIGVIALNRQGGAGSDFNRTLGLDSTFAFGTSTVLTGLFAKSFSPGPGGKDLAGAFDLDWKNDHVSWGLTYADIGERFNAEMGYIPRRDIRNSKAQASWTPRPKWRGVRQLTLSGNVDYFENHQGVPDSRTQDVSFALLRSDNSRFSIGATRDFDLLPADWRIGAGTIPRGGYGWNTLRMSYSTNNSLRVYGGGSVDYGGYYSGDKTTYRGDINFLPLETLLFENNFTRNQVTLPGRPSYYTNTINSRISYSLSPELFVKSFMQFNDERKLANVNLLFWYIYKPGSDFYVVYNQGWNTDAPGPKDISVRNRFLAVKFTYWLSR